KKNKGGFIVAGENYGQGSSREHAALVPLYLGIKAVFAKSFARIHKANLINNGIMPLEFLKVSDYDSIDEFDEFIIENAREAVESGKVVVKNITKNKTYNMSLQISERQKNMILKGGLINSIKCSDE
ncbi:aconitate hydratase, partial [Clostridium botulinum D/C]|nr:aconitate hydratase [Clostridium botulinum D/C]